VYGIFDDFLIVSSIIAALLAGKWAAAWLVGRASGYNLNEQLTIWSLTLPQVAATLAKRWLRIRLSTQPGSDYWTSVCSMSCLFWCLQHLCLVRF
jgi:hypothetical protein